MAFEVNEDYEIIPYSPLTINIEKGIPVPRVQRVGNLSYNKQLSAMQVGDSFLVPIENIDSAVGMVSKWNSIHGKPIGHKIIRRRVSVETWRYFKVAFKHGSAHHYRDQIKAPVIKAN